MKIDPSLERAVPVEIREKIRDVSVQFESLLVNQMLGEMRKTVDREESLIPHSQAEQMFQSLLDSEYSQKVSERGDFGLSEMVYQQLLQTIASK